jgi:hypothetical protein
MLEQALPAFVDRRWNPARWRRPAGILRSAPPPMPGAPPPNLAEALLAPDALRPFIVNWQETARFFLRGVQADAAADGTAETADLLARLLSYPGLPALYEALPPEEAKAPVLAIDFRKGETAFRLFTTIATLGTPLDVTLQEIRVECFFPMRRVARCSGGCGRTAVRLPKHVRRGGASRALTALFGTVRPARRAARSRPSMARR